MAGAYLLGIVGVLFVIFGLCSHLMDRWHHSQLELLDQAEKQRDEQNKRKKS